MTSPNQLSFLPDDYLSRKAQRRTTVICALLTIIVMGAVGSAFAFTERSMREFEKQHAQIEKQYADAARRIEQVQQMQEKQRKMARQAELTASLLEKVPRTFILAEITNSMPVGVWLLDMSLDSKRRAPAAAKSKTLFEQKKAAAEAKKGATPPTEAAEVKVYDVHLKITGVAITDVEVAQFISKLSQSSVLQDVNLIISEEFVQEDNKVRRFQIEMILDPDAQVQPAMETSTTAVSIQAE